MRSLCYRSHALVAGPSMGVGSPLAVLVARAQLRNTKLQVTGALLLEHDRFVQIIEGPGQAIDTLYADICADTRHTGVELVWRRDVPVRDFPNWSLLAVDILAPDLSFLFAGVDPPASYTPSAVRQLRLMHHLARAPAAVA